MGDAEKLIESLNQQYNTRTLRRNMEMYILHKVGGLSYEEIGARFHVSRQRVGIILKSWEAVLRVINSEEEVQKWLQQSGQN